MLHDHLNGQLAELSPPNEAERYKELVQLQREVARLRATRRYWRQQMTHRHPFFVAPEQMR